MLREEVKYASKDYVNYLLDKQEYHNEKYTEHDIKQAFEKGAEWADEHPKLPWISIKDDLPCNHKELTENESYTKKVLVVLAWKDDPSKKHIEICNMCNKIGSFNTIWYWRQYKAFYRVVYWKPLPELPKE